MGAYAPIELGCEAYIIRDGKLLLGKRKNTYGAGTWGMPGGRLEPMERAGEAIIRECKEELDIELSPKNIALLAITDDPRPNEGSHHFHVTFRVDIGTQEPKLNEPHACEEWGWFALDQLPDPIFSPHVRILATIESGQTYQV